MAESLSQTLADIQSSLDDLAAGLIAVPRGPGSIKGGMIAPNTVTATNINVQKLAAVSTDTGSLSVTGSLVMTTSGVFSAGQTAYNTGIGWWLEYNGGTPRLSLGDSANAHLTWDGSALSIVGANLILDSGGTFGDVFLIQHAGTDQGALYASAGGIILVQGTPSVQGAYLSLGATSFSLNSNAGPVLTSSGADIFTAGKIYPAGQSDAYFDYHTTFTAIRVGGSYNFEVTGSLMTPIATGATGTMPGATKYMTVLNASGLAFYIPVYSSPISWTA